MPYLPVFSSFWIQEAPKVNTQFRVSQQESSSLGGDNVLQIKINNKVTMKFNKTSIAAMFIISIMTVSANAETQKTSKSKKQTSTVTNSAKTKPETGPVAFGTIKLGMSKASIEVLTSQDGFYLNAPMTPFEYSEKIKAEPGKDVFNGLLISPYSAEPLKATFTFKEDALVRIGFNLENKEALFNELKAMVEKKYGQPITKGEMKEEQCLYKNGANFKIKDGIVSYIWTKEIENSIDEEISTTFTDMAMAMCPSSLNSPIFNVKMKSFGIGITKKTAPKPEAF